MRKKLFIATTLVFILCSFGLAVAQPNEPPLIPIDGGIGILLAAGAIYGAKKLNDLTQNKRK